VKKSPNFLPKAMFLSKLTLTVEKQKFWAYFVIEKRAKNKQSPNLVTLL
jgi:hypothetical protein